MLSYWLPKDNGKNSSKTTTKSGAFLIKLHVGIACMTALMSTFSEWMYREIHNYINMAEILHHMFAKKCHIFFLQ
jgi:uncharacterized membrane protein